MKRSKHFRKDVILARVVFGILCIIIGVLIGMGVSAISKAVKNNEGYQTEREETPTYDIPQFEDTEEETEVVEVVYYAKTTAEVRLRKEPNTNCAVVMTVPSGAKTTMIEEVDGWYKVLYNDQEGYIRADYIEIIEEQVSPRNSGRIVMIDPGHQAQKDMEEEPNGPDSTEMKARVAGGTKGSTTGVYEYELTLEIGLMLREELESRGYTVLMTRETHDVNISNMERAQMANEAKADIAVRIHANHSDDTGVYGAECLAPSTGNVYVGDIADESQKLCQCIISAYCNSTGMSNRGVQINDTLTGTNWSEIPVAVLELGFMSNPTDDTNMQDDNYQKKMVQGIADGIDKYFEQ